VQGRGCARSDQHLAVHPGRDIAYVVDDTISSRDRVAFAHEDHRHVRRLRLRDAGDLRR
jgi:hypothetical protein